MSTGAIIGICCGSAVIIVGTIATIIVCKKK